MASSRGSVPGMNCLTSNTSSSKTRQRAKKACIGCRMRKVRCDVTVKGAPCTNCQLDDKTCFVRKRAFRRQSLGRAFNSSGVDESGRLGSEPSLQSFGELTELAGPPLTTGAELDRALYASGKESPDTAAAATAGDGSPSHSPDQAQRERTHEIPRPEQLAGSPPKSAPGVVDANTPSPLYPGTKGSDLSLLDETMVAYTTYPFLIVSNLAGLCPQDVAFLEAKGAFHVPIKPILDEFIRQYFLHVHPLCPLLHEGEFWSVYRQDERAGPAKTISLLLFQAVIFASSSFLPEVVIKALGYSSIRSARAVFYRNVKVLHDFSVEDSPFVIAQTAVLMTLWCPVEPRAVPSSSMWLQLAIQNARFVDAHLAWDAAVSPITTANRPQPSRRMLRRLWWSCVIRDRALALGLRRGLQVTTTQPSPYMADFESEMSRSEVYAWERKQVLARLFLRMAQLCNILTDLLTYPPDASESPLQSAGILTDCRQSLQRWHDGLQHDLANSCGGSRKHSVTVHTNLVLMAYYSARSIISRQAILLSCYQPQIPARSSSTDYEWCREMREAALGTAECVSELVRLDLTRYLPFSALAFIAIPLLIHVLDVRLVCPETLTGDLEARFRRLRVLIDVLKVYRPRYEGVEWFSYTIRYTVDLAQFHAPTIPDGLVSSWADLVRHQPSLSLRLALTVDLSLSKASLPNDRDFPMILREIFMPRGGYGQGPIWKGLDADLDPPIPSRQQDSGGEVVIKSPEKTKSSDVTTPGMETCREPEPDHALAVPHASGLADGTEDVVNGVEQGDLESIILSCPSVVAEHGQDTGLMNSPHYRTLAEFSMEGIDPLLSYNLLVGDECDMDILMDSNAFNDIA